jgi:D123
VVDVYAGVNGNGMYLIDIAPLCEYTDTLLFTIDEVVLGKFVFILMMMLDGTVADEIRVVGSQAAANDYSMNEHENGSNRLPKDSEGLRCVDNGFVVDELVRMVNESR